VTLVDLQNHRRVQPLPYQVATASLDICDIAEPLCSLFCCQRNIAVG
jgi:hypothetical protein